MTDEDEKIIRNRLNSNLATFRTKKTEWENIKSSITQKTHNKNLFVKDLGIMRGVCVNMEHATQYMQTGTDYLEEGYKGIGAIKNIQKNMSDYKQKIASYEKTAKEIRDAEKKEIEKLEKEIEDLKIKKEKIKPDIKVSYNNIKNDSALLNESVPSDIVLPSDIDILDDN